MKTTRARGAPRALYRERDDAVHIQSGANVHATVPPLVEVNLDEQSDQSLKRSGRSAAGR